jgi:hypothetical protein
MNEPSRVYTILGSRLRNRQGWRTLLSTSSATFNVIRERHITRPGEKCGYCLASLQLGQFWQAQYMHICLEALQLKQTEDPIAEDYMQGHRPQMIHPNA